MPRHIEIIYDKNTGRAVYRVDGKELSREEVLDILNSGNFKSIELEARIYYYEGILRRFYVIYSIEDGKVRVIYGEGDGSQIRTGEYEISEQEFIEFMDHLEKLKRSLEEPNIIDRMYAISKFIDSSVLMAKSKVKLQTVMG